MNKQVLEELVQLRLLEASTLISARCFQGAYYLAGYSLECAFKACIAKQVEQYDFPDLELARSSYSHRLVDLVGVAGLKQELSAQERRDKRFGLHWIVAKNWSEKSRYERSANEQWARNLYNAITDEKSGILVWVKRFW